jgi:hypothetical protein
MKNRGTSFYEWKTEVEEDYVAKSSRVFADDEMEICEFSFWEGRADM